MSLSRDVSNALDIMGQAPGTVLVRGPDRWFALEPSAPGQFLALDENGIPSWETGLVPPLDPTDWITPTYENGWGDFSVNWQAGRFRRTNVPSVMIEGLATGGVQSQTLAIFTLPDGMRPSERLLLATQSGGAIGRLRIDPDGRVYPMTYNGSNITMNVEFGLELD